MLTLLKNGNVYAPRPLGKADVLIGGARILGIGREINLSCPEVDTDVIDLAGMTVVPGFVDQHVHILGGGGEGGPATMTPEFAAEDALLAGATSVVGCLGADGTSRHVDSLFVRARALECSGLSTYIFTGAYEVPVPTITGSIRTDLVLIDKVIGVGEIAISDHRSSQPTRHELERIAADARMGGLLAGKAGKVHLHVGDGRRGLSMIMDIAETTELPVEQFVPTHVNRSRRLLEEAAALCRAGGFVDLTAMADDDGSATIPAAQAFSTLIELGAPPFRITMSSDGNGSIPRFDRSGRLTGMGVGSVRAVLDSLITMVRDHGIPLERALATITSNVSACYTLKAKGRLDVGADADITVLDKELNVRYVFSMGSLTVKDGMYLSSATQGRMVM